MKNPVILIPIINLYEIKQKPLTNGVCVPNL